MIAPNIQHLLTRRLFLSHTSAGLGMAAVASLIGGSARVPESLPIELGSASNQVLE